MNELDHELKEQGLHVIGVNLDEKVASAQEFLASHPVDFSIVADPSKQCAKGFEVMAMPTLIEKETFVIFIGDFVLTKRKSCML